jgi:hypothetical protein
MAGARHNSVTALSELYTVVIGVALSIAIANSLDASAHPVPLKLSTIINVFTFIVLIVPFYHGAVRHLFATYVEQGGSKPIKNGALLADFFLLFFEGCLFVLMAAVLNDTVAFGWVLVALLMLDSVWGFLAWLAFASEEAQYAERLWSLINAITAVLLALILIFLDQTFVSRPLLSEVGVFAIIALRTIVDYALCWSFYFPEA